jgi:glyoxylase-like metal-dependent hydrolase (beta-lactamase superfamily II)
MKMHVLAAGRLRMKKSVYLPLPEVERTEPIELPVHSILLRHPQGNVLFDTGCHPSTITDATARWGTMAKAMTPIGPPEENLISQLTLLDIRPDDIDVVINSHLHSDHCGCNEFFKRATMICNARELAVASGETGLQQGYIPADWKTAQPYDTFDTQRDVYGDGRIVLIPLPGHTPGMSGALVALDRDGEFLLASDAVALRRNLDEDITPRNTWNADDSSRSFNEIRRIRNGGATIVFGHDDEQWQSLRKGLNAYE